MPLPEKKDQLIKLEEAAKLTARSRAKKGKNAEKGGAFWKEYIQKIVDQPGCVAVRYYDAEDADGVHTLVLVGVDKEGNDMTSGALVEGGVRCPPWCSVDNPLNK